MLPGVAEALAASVRIVTNLDTSPKSITTSLDEPSSLVAIQMAIAAKQKELEAVMAENPEGVFQLINRGRRVDILNFELNQLKYRREFEDAELYKAKKHFPAIADLADDVLIDYEKALMIGDLTKTRMDLAHAITSARTHKERIGQLKCRLGMEKSTSIGDDDTSSSSDDDTSSESAEFTSSDTDEDDEPIAQIQQQKKRKFTKSDVVPAKKSDNGSRAL